MPACPSCGRENPDGARFCNACGAELVELETARESRKVVTVLFCDLVGSTALGESTDPEALRTRMRRYFDDLRTIIERPRRNRREVRGRRGHGRLRDPRLARGRRAPRRARRLGDARGDRQRTDSRRGSASTPGRSSSAVRARRSSPATRSTSQPGSSRQRPPARRSSAPRPGSSSADAVRVEPVEPLALKGKSEPVVAFRLLEVRGAAEALARHPEAPLVGRVRERERLWRDFEDAVAERTCRLFTLLGPAGIGKSRLVADFLDRVSGDADILRGRCLHYGEDITYWPLVEILIGIGVDPDNGDRLLAGGDAARLSPPARDPCSRAPADRPDRRPPVGRADVHRRRRAHR